MLSISARVKGLLLPSWPSSAVWPGPVATAISVPSPEDELDLGIAHGLLEGQVDVDGCAQLDVHLRFDVGIDRQEIVAAADRDAVAGVVEHGDVGALRLAAEIQQLLGHLVAGEVGAFDHLEADIAQRRCHRLGVDRRVRQLRDVLVGAVADDESDAAVGLRGTDRQRHAHQ